MTRILAAFAALAASAAFANPMFEADTKVTRAEMAKLADLKGEWKGTGWFDVPGRGRVPVTSQEWVHEKLGGSVLTIEGLHKDPQTGAVYHHAYGLLTWDAARKEFRINTALEYGRGGQFPGVMDGNKFTWRIEPPNGPKMRYVITITPDTWEEVGERTTDGTTWTTFFGMTLKKVK